MLIIKDTDFYKKIQWFSTSLLSQLMIIIFLSNRNDLLMDSKINKLYYYSIFFYILVRFQYIYLYIFLNSNLN